MNENRIILTAFILSLVLHLGLAVVLWKTPLELEISIAQAREPDQDEIMVELMTEEEAAALDSQLPTRFTLVPERLATDEAPENPDYASLFNSRAADRESGGEGDVPKAAREGDFEQVTILEDGLPPSEGVEFRQEALPVPRPREEAATERAAAGGPPEARPGEETTAEGAWALPEAPPDLLDQGEDSEEDAGEEPTAEEGRDPVEEWWNEQAPSILRESQGQPGDRGFDFNQVEQGRQGVGVSFVGDYSLNTYEWNYAPWMKTFMSQLQRHWKAPYAYSYLGMIHGQTILKVVVATDGRLRSLEILDTEGHQSLHEASEAAMRAFAPYAPLPEGFPEEELVMTWRLIYPALRR